MVEKIKSSVTKANEERSILQHMGNKAIKSYGLMKKAFDGYSDKAYVSPDNVPKSAKSTDEVLERYNENNGVKSFYEFFGKRDALCSKELGLLKGAISVAENPIKGKRASYDRAYDDLIIMEENAALYSALDAQNPQAKTDHKTTAGGINVTHVNGFHNELEFVSLVNSFLNDFKDLMDYTNVAELNYNDLPKNLSELKAIAAPSDFGNDDIKAPEGEVPVEEGARFKQGGAKFLKKLNEDASAPIIKFIADEKAICFKNVMKLQMEFNQCSNDPKNFVNIDFKCAYIDKKATTLSDNCHSHYPITKNDAASFNSMEQLAEVYYIDAPDGSSVIDYEYSAGLIKDFVEILQLSQGESTVRMTEFYENTAQVSEAVDDLNSILSGNTERLDCGDYCN